MQAPRNLAPDNCRAQSTAAPATARPLPHFLVVNKSQQKSQKATRFIDLLFGPIQRSFFNTRKKDPQKVAAMKTFHW
jgi:hypothetical protein